MSTEETIRYVLSFLGGGVVSALIAWARESVAARRRGEVERLQSQLESLYGPLHFFTTQAVKLLALVNGIDTAYRIEYVGRKWSPEEATQEALKKETDTVINLGNRYVAKVDRNNDEIMKILESHWNLIDSDDTDVFARFEVDYIRMRTERGQDGGVSTPYRVLQHIGGISFMPPEFVARVSEKFQTKRVRLDRLLGYSRASIFGHAYQGIKVFWTWWKAGWRR